MKKVKMGSTFSDSLYFAKSFKRFKNFSDPNNLKFRARWFLIIFLTIFTVFFTRLFDLQIIKGNYYQILSDKNRIRTQIIYAPRGIIFDRNKNPLVYNIPGFRQANGNKITFLTSSQLTPILANSLGIQLDSLRFYPYKASLAHILGFVGQISESELKNPAFSNYDSNDVVGKSGIEYYYNQILRGENGKKLIEVNADGNFVRNLGQTDPIPGQNITLEIDKDLQEKVYQAMRGVKKGAAIVSTPNGAILALVSKPSFDPNLFTLGSSYKGASESSYKNVASILNDNFNNPFLNRAISGVYPPGSTFKLVVGAIALEDGIINKDFSITDSGIIKIANFSFSNWYYSQYGKTDGQVNIVKAIKRSNDIFFYQVGHLLGVKKLSTGASKFGLGKTLGIDLPNEASGFLPTSAWKEKTFKEPWFLGDDYHYGIGQGYLLTTPLQVNAWTQAIANGGTLYKPHLLKETSKIENTNLLSKENFDLIRQGMIEACSPGGVGWPLFNFSVKRNKKIIAEIDDKNFFTLPEATISANLKNRIGISLACKTGTAQQGGQNALPHAWMTLFAPAYNPQIIVTVLVENSGEGSNVAGPIVKQITTDYFEN